jgi:hypothetical protein
MTEQHIKLKNNRAHLKDKMSWNYSLSVNFSYAIFIVKKTKTYNLGKKQYKLKLNSLRQ